MRPIFGRALAPVDIVGGKSKILLKQTILLDD